ncbi:MAG TPA: PIN domain-containing protein [Pseudonocardiaceae bacterium]|nr:PIN domain-containing protein [Pseudonocardiaceae bacterium]
MSIVYDTGALLAAERGDRAMWAVHSRGLDRARQPVVPAVVLGQAWRGGPQPQLSRLLKGCVIESFDENAGRAAGRLLRDAGTSDVVDAHVVLTALRHRAAVLTADPDDLQRLAATTGIRLRLLRV